MNWKTCNDGYIFNAIFSSTKNAAFANLDQHHSAGEVARRAVGMFDELLGNLDVITEYFKVRVTHSQHPNLQTRVLIY